MLLQKEIVRGAAVHRNYQFNPTFDREASSKLFNDKFADQLQQHLINTSFKY
jgi:hypothetical protein